jgi:hypothetical protein
MDFLPHCGVLENLNVSGMTGVNDDFVHKLCRVAPTIIHLNIMRSLSITDAALCSIADYLFLSTLDASYCTRLTDAGVEVLALALSTGLEKLMLRRCHKLSPLGLSALARNCHKLKQLDIRQCPRIDEDAMKDLMRQQKFIKVFRLDDD